MNAPIIPFPQDGLWTVSQACEWLSMTVHSLRTMLKPREIGLLGYAPEFLQPIILTALDSCMRRGEIMRMKWADVDFDQRLIRVAESKSHKTRYMPINDTLKVILESIEHFTGPKGPSPCVFTNPVTGRATRTSATHSTGRRPRRASTT